MMSVREYNPIDIESGLLALTIIRLETGARDYLARATVLLTSASEYEPAAVRAEAAWHGMQGNCLRQAALHAQSFHDLLSREKIHYADNPAESRRIARNIALVRNVLKALAGEGGNVSLWRQWTSICRLEYEISTREWLCIRAKKLFLTLLATLMGFVIGVITGMSIPAGGIAALPAAIYASLKSATGALSAVLAGASAGAAGSIVGPAIYGCTLAHEEVRRQTGSPIEAHMVALKNLLLLHHSDSLGMRVTTIFLALSEHYQHSRADLPAALARILHHARQLEYSAHHFFALGKAGKRKKGRAVRLATLQVMNYLLNENINHDITFQTILALTIYHEGREVRYSDILDTRRHPFRDKITCLLFTQKTHSRQIADQSCHAVIRGQPVLT